MIALEVNDDRGRLTKRLVKDIHADLKLALASDGLLSGLDYFEIAIGKRKTEKVPFPRFEWLSCTAVTGKAGGHYIYVGTVSQNRHNLVFVGKTSKGFQAACEVANMCAKQLSA
jgi:hypothetical protein